MLHRFIFQIVLAFILLGLATADEIELEESGTCQIVSVLFSRLGAGFQISRSTGSVDLMTNHGTTKRMGCSVALFGPYPKDPNQMPDSMLLDYFSKNQWEEILLYSADGVSGTQFGYFKNGVFCLTNAEWNGGGLNAPPPTTFKLNSTCVRATLETIVD